MLQINNVNTHYGPIQALHDVSINIEEGEIVTPLSVLTALVRLP